MKKLDIRIFEADEQKEKEYNPSYSTLSTIYEKILNGCTSLISGINVGFKDRSQFRDKVNYSVKGLSLSLKSDYQSRSMYSISCSIKCKKDESLNYSVSLSTRSKAYETEDGFSRSSSEGAKEIQNRSDLSKVADKFLSMVEKVISACELKEDDLSGNGNSAATYSAYRIIAKEIFTKYSYPQWLGTVSTKLGDDSMADCKLSGKNEETGQKLTIYCAIGKDSARFYCSKDSVSLKYKDFKDKEDFKSEFSSKFDEFMKQVIE